MRVVAYIDNCLIGPNLDQDLTEKGALEEIKTLTGSRGDEFILQTSNRTANEYEQWQDEAGREAMRQDHATKGRVNRDHTVKGFFSLWDQYGGGGCFPMVADVPNEDVYAELRALGIQDMDAEHIAIAIH